MKKPSKEPTKTSRESNQEVQAEAQETQGEDTPLGKCEKQIRVGRRTYYIIGKQLNIIKTKELFREKGFESFEEYCEKTWHYKKKYPFVLINASKVRKSLEFTFQQDQLPDSAKALELLHKLQPDDRVSV